MKLTATILIDVVKQINKDYVVTGYKLTVKDLLDIIQESQDLDD